MRNEFESYLKSTSEAPPQFPMVRSWWEKDSNLRSLRNRFTAGSLWPLRYPT
jgi:hypothetical protein